MIFLHTKIFRMNRILYYDCFSGISGDMNLAALIDLGIDVKHVIDELKKLKLDGYQIVASQEIRNGITGTQIKVLLENQVSHSFYLDKGLKSLQTKPQTGMNQEKHHYRTYKEIKQIIEQSDLSENVKQTSIAIFEKLAIAEGKIHGVTPDKVHFHEVGAIDSIVDIVGAAICIDYLKPDKIVSSPLELGSGTVTFSHGTYPVPAPATTEVLKNIPVRLGNVPFEATTPTGAAIIATIANEFSEKINFSIEKIGYGIGHKNEGNRPNILRIIFGTQQIQSNYLHEEALLIECNIDDMNPEAFEHVFESLFEVGAQDVFITPIIMKKLRPAQKISVICLPSNRESIIHVLLKHTTTLGVRETRVDKWMLQRETVEVQTSLGPVRVKKSYFENMIKMKPEYEDCLTLAKKHNLPVITVMNIIQKELQA